MAATSSSHGAGAAPAKTETKEMLVEDLSRMEGTYGGQAIGRLKAMDVFISGMNGLGIETVKNLLLAGPRSVTIHDDEKVVLADLGANFYLHAEDIGRGRGASVIRHLETLNPNVSTALHTGEIKTDFLSHFNVVVFTDRTPARQLEVYNNFCRSRTKVVRGDKGVETVEPDPIVFLYGSIDGVFSSIFADFGPKHHVFDLDGVPEKSVMLDHITQATEGVVTIDGERHLLSTGDVVRIEEVEGMSVAGTTAVEGKIYKKDDIADDANALFSITEYRYGPKKVLDPRRFTISNTKGLGEYKGGGMATQVKQGQDFSYKSWKSQLSHPTLMPGYFDFTKMGRAEQLHLARLALFRFQEDKGTWPALHDEKDSKQLADYARAILRTHTTPATEGGAIPEEFKGAIRVDAIDEKVFANVSLYARTELSPLAALMGGVLAQEIVKQTGKFTPIEQWFHFDAMELLFDAVPSDATPPGSRHDHQVSLFGRAFQDKLQRQNVFMVGCGALGCEYLKMIAMTGLGTLGGVHITDDDRIELTNLSRQFLFRRQHIGKTKSACSAEAVIAMNPALRDRLRAHEIRVETKSEDHFTDAYWNSLDFVLNALDNNIARRYVDSKCVLHLKPLFESGTLGTQANSVVCLPHKTPSYSEGAVAGETQGIAKCTLRNFPSDPLHCIEWAREMFDEIFVAGPDAYNSFKSGREAFYTKLAQEPLEQRPTLELVKRWVELSKRPTFDLCLQLAHDVFTNHYRNAIRDLQHNFPKDARIIEKDTGADLGAFWHGHKRFPVAQEYDAKNELHLDYVFHAANILANTFGLPFVTDRALVRGRSAAIRSSAWVAGAGKVDMSEGKATTVAVVDDDDKKVIVDLTAHLNSIDVSTLRTLVTNEFEKDIDSNHHIDWITCATNLRCVNYTIKLTSRATCRMTAGKIIPAIATTTAMITGFIGLEVFKYIREVPLEAHRAATVNLSTNVFCVESLPDPLKKKTGLDPETYMQCTAVPEGFTTWDKIEIKSASMTMGELLEAFPKLHHGAVLSTITSVNGKILYGDFGGSSSDSKEKLRTRVIDLYTRVEGAPAPESRDYIILVAAGVDDKDGNTAIVPKIQFYFK